MTTVFGWISPHPPLLVPIIGGKRVNEVSATNAAMQKVAQDLKLKEVDVIIVFTPHGSVSQVTLPVYASHVFDGNFAAFGHAKPNYAFKGDPALALKIVKHFEDVGLPVSRVSETLLDHGTLVPLHFVAAAKIAKPVLPIAAAFLPLKELFIFGRELAKSCFAAGKRVAVIGSADLSHRLSPDAPSGFNARGKEFDEKLVELVKKNDVDGILNFDQKLAEVAGQDALWSIVLLLGMLDGQGLKPEVLSYEGPFGVGYMVAEYK